MISANIFRLLAAGCAVSLGALAAPAEAAVFQASTGVSIEALSGPFTESVFSLPQYSGPGTIVGVNMALSGSASGSDYYPYDADGSVTVSPYSTTWTFDLVGPIDSNVAFLNVSTTAKFRGGSCVDTDPACAGYGLGFFAVSSGPNAFSGSVNVSNFSDYAGGGSNDFYLVAAGFQDSLSGSATVTETILAAVPQAPTWVMALIGFAIVGFAAHGRRLARPLAARRWTNETV